MKLIESPVSYQFHTTTQAAWDAMYQTLLKAEKSIYWEVYILTDDSVGRRFIDLLCAKALTGVDVKIIVDGLGSVALSGAAEARLKASGVSVVWYNSISFKPNLWLWVRNLWIRNHRKILIVDQGTAFIGGVNVDAMSTAWDDLHLEMEGPIVQSLTRAFAKSYIRSGGDREAVAPLLKRTRLFDLEKLRNKINVLMHTPKSLRAVSSLWYFYRFAMERAERTVTMLTPYYVPDKRFLRLIKETKNRGVTINILIPGRSDHRFMEYMAESFYELTARAGANLFLLKNMNHGKALSVDGRLGFVGSANITPRSFFLNEEAGVYFTDRPMVADLDRVLEAWRSGAERVVVAQNRNWYDRLLRPVVAWFKNYV